MPGDPKQPTPRRVLIVAGEASGDLHGAGLIKEMRKIHPDIEFCGIGGNCMRDEGVRLLAHASDMAIIGFKEIVPKLGFLRNISRRIKDLLRTWKPDLVVLIDYPDFNLNVVARAAKKSGVPVFYYISPQVWAWRKGRIRQIKKRVDRMAVILPFEVDVYAEKGFHVDFVGHPLLDLIKTRLSPSEARRELGLDESKPTIGILPGSRLSEIKKLMPELLKAAAILKNKIPEMQFVIPLADTLEEKDLTDMMTGSRLDVKVISGHTYDVVSCADLALVASGTATLETALLKIPMIIVYKISLLSYFIGRLFVHVKHIGLVNIIAGKTVVPELIQNDACGARIAEEALAILNNKARQREMISELETIRARLGEPGAAIKTAKLALDMLYR